MRSILLLTLMVTFIPSLGSGQTSVLKGLLAGGSPGSSKGDYGTFEGEVVTRFNPDGRTMTLVQDFAFVDAGGTRWEAPAGSVIDGASIPQFAWSFIGGPFEGLYRNASVLHDVACVILECWGKTTSTVRSSP